MPDPLDDFPLRYLRTPEAARFVGLSIRTLEKHRTYCTGPRYSKLGGRVVYRLEDSQAWVELGAKTSTSDPGVGMVLPAKPHATHPPNGARYHRGGAGCTARASAIGPPMRVTLKHGPRFEREVQSAVEREVEAGRWTGLDLALRETASEVGSVADLRPDAPDEDPELRRLMVGRAAKLGRFGLADGSPPAAGL